MAAALAMVVLAAWRADQGCCGGGANGMEGRWLAAGHWCTDSNGCCRSVAGCAKLVVCHEQYSRRACMCRAERGTGELDIEEETMGHSRWQVCRRVRLDCARWLGAGVAPLCQARNRGRLVAHAGEAWPGPAGR